MARRCPGPDVASNALDPLRAYAITDPMKCVGSKLGRPAAMSDEMSMSESLVSAEAFASHVMATVALY
jgi:hypothetical protein